MPRAAGTYIAPASSWSPAVVSTSATPVDFNALLTDLSNALTQSMSRDGTSPPTANLPMAAFKITSLGPGTSSGDSLRFDQLFSQGLETDVASAATSDIGVITSNLIRITGTTGITSFGTNYNGPRFIRFAGIVTLTNSATLVLPFSTNLTTAANDLMIVVPLGNPATGWQVVSYQPARTGLGGFVTLSGTETLTNKTVINGVYTSYQETVNDLGTGAAFSPLYATAAIHKLVTNANTTITLDTSGAGLSMVIWVKYGGAHTITFAGGTLIKYASGAAPIATSALNKFDKYLVTCVDGTFSCVSDGGRNI